MEAAKWCASKTVLYRFYEVRDKVDDYLTIPVKSQIS